jgi:uncharacterized protein YndB with AHSA1/START domain
MRKIIHAVNINAKRDKVYRAVASEEGLANWWTTDVKADVRVGGKIAFRFAGEFSPDMEITRLEEPRRVDWKCVGGEPLWQDNSFSFELDDRGERTMLLFTQDYAAEISDEEYGTFNFNWGHYLGSLKQYCEAGKGYPFEGR